MITFNEAEEKKKTLKILKQWEKIDIVEFINSLNVRPFVKRDLKRRYKNYGTDLLKGMTPDEFKGIVEYSEQLELSLIK